MPEVRFTARARRSLAAQDDWLRARNPAVADRFLSEVERAASRLADDPLIGPRVPGAAGSRSLLTRRYLYRLVYRVVGGEVVILDILHPRQSGP